MQSLRPYAIAGPPLILGEGQHLKQQWRRQSHPVGVLDPSFGVQAFPHEKICGVTSDEPIGGKPPATAQVSSSVLPPVSSAWSCRCGRGSPSQIERQGDFKETLPVQYCTGSVSLKSPCRSICDGEPRPQRQDHADDTGGSTLDET